CKTKPILRQCAEGIGDPRMSPSQPRRRWRPRSGIPLRVEMSAETEAIMTAMRGRATWKIGERLLQHVFSRCGRFDIVRAGCRFRNRIPILSHGCKVHLDCAAH